MEAIDRYNPTRFRIPFRAGVAKSVDAVDSKSTVEIRAGSSPAFGTIRCKNKSPRAAFFVFEIQHLPALHHIFTLSGSTDINVRVPTDVGSHDGISGSIIFVPMGGLALPGQISITERSGRHFAW